MDDGLINTFCACLSNTFFIVKHAKRKIKRSFLLGVLSQDIEFFLVLPLTQLFV